MNGFNHQKGLKVETDLLLIRYLAAALTLAMLPAGEMWSVVTLSPRNSKACAFSSDWGGGTSLLWKRKRLDMNHCRSTNIRSPEQPGAPLRSTYRMCSTEQRPETKGNWATRPVTSPKAASTESGIRHICLCVQSCRTPLFIISRGHGETRVAHSSLISHLWHRGWRTYQFAKERRWSDISGLVIPGVKYWVWTFNVVPKCVPFLKDKKDYL